MKQTKKFIAFQDKENRLAYKVGLCDSMQDALTLDYDAYERQKEQIDTLAEALGCHIVVVEATHEIKMLDGSDAPEPEERNSQSGFLDLLEALRK